MKHLLLLQLMLLLGWSGVLRADETRPNIPWLAGEDANVKWFGCYGSTQTTTPNIDRLAQQG